MFNFKYVDIKWYIVLLVVALSLALIAAIYLLVTFVQRKKGVNDEFTTKDISYAAVCVAIAYVLSFFGYTLPYGGTITAFSTVPIIIYCYYFGFKKSLAVCCVYTFLQLLQNPSIIHPLSVVLDYIIPYMLLSIVGIFMYSSKRFTSAKNPIAAHFPIYIGCLIYIILRYVSHVISGVAFWHMYAWDDWSVWPYSFAYNSFVLIDFAISMAALTGLLLSKTFNTFMASHRNTLQNPNPATKHD